MGLLGGLVSLSRGLANFRVVLERKTPYRSFLLKYFDPPFKIEHQHYHYTS